ncbi:MAG: SPOR domain-containing protein [Rhodoferax sp.]|nr:SPOR domain-containing protein [Rhodoferax sp.]
MLRFFVLLLLLANGAFFAWSQGYLKAFGYAPAAPNEPQRLVQQIKPENIQLLQPADVKRMEAQAEQALAEQAPKVCLQAGPFDDVQAVVLRKALEAGLPSGAWQLDAVKQSAQWVIYMGKYASTDLQTKKRAELVTLGLKAEPVANPELAPGLTLGVFATQAAANTGLERLKAKGLRTAKVVQAREDGVQTWLKLPAVSEVLQSKLDGLKPALADKAFKNCS